MTQFITQALNSWGLVAVLALMTIESCGVPFPSEVIMPFAGVLAVTGHLGLGAAIIAGALGNVVGSLIAYGLAARWGEPLLLGPGRRVGIRRSHVELADRWFVRYGLAAIFFGRMLPVIRTYISFPAGLARVRLMPFTLLTGLGALPWCAALGIAGYELGGNWDRVSGPIEKVAIILGVLAVAVIVAWFVRGRRRSSAAAV